MSARYAYVAGIDEKEFGDLPEDAPALCVTGCGSPVAYEGAYCDPCDRDWLNADAAAKRRQDV